MFTAVATQMLRDAGYKVTPADMVPGLWDVEGLARDVTTAQLHQLAEATWLCADNAGGITRTPN